MHARAFLADIYNFLLRPKKYAASGTIHIKNLYHRIFRFIFSGEVSRREKLEAELPTSAPFQISEQKGFAQVTGLDENLKQEVILEAKRILKEKLTPDTLAKWKNHPFVLLYINDKLDSKNVFLRYALQKPLLKALRNYLGILPVIESISVWYSPNQTNFAGSSQLYHLDGQDVKTLQLFVYLEDVNTDNGPLVVVDAEPSEKLANEIGYRKNKILRRIDDDLVKTRTNPENIMTLTGKAGESYIVDTDRCLHYGSRKANKPRYVVVFQYYTPFAFVLPFKWWTQLPYARLSTLGEFSALERAVLGAKE